MNLTIGPLVQADIDSADLVFRLAFGTQSGMGDPSRFDGDAARIRTRILAENVIKLGAKIDGVLVAASLATIWGEFGWLGPLSVLPQYWDRGIGQKLVQSTIGELEQQGCRHLALFTFEESAKHIGLYSRFGFRPRSPIVIMEKGVSPVQRGVDIASYSKTQAEHRGSYISHCREIAGLLYPGLDLSTEIVALQRQQLGDTLFVLRDGRVDAFAVCHCGAGPEAGSSITYVKFAAARPSPHVDQTLEEMMLFCESLAAESKTTRLLAGVNTARRGAYAKMVEHGFEVVRRGIAMHRPDEPSYDRPDVYALDDWR